MKIDETNYRTVAKKAIDKYFDKMALLDALFWKQIVAYYEADLAKLAKKDSKIDGEDVVLVPERR